MKAAPRGRWLRDGIVHEAFNVKPSLRTNVWQGVCGEILHRDQDNDAASHTVLDAPVDCISCLASPMQRL